MANICWFEIRMRGTKENCMKMVQSDIHCYDIDIKAQNGTDDDYMVYLSGNCRWSVTTSMINVDEEESLAVKAKNFQLELEVCGLDEGGECSEHFHYKGDEVIKENNLPPTLPVWGVESGEFGWSAEDIQKYNKDEAAGMYILKDEFLEHFEYDYELDRPVFNFTMSFRDLPGFEDFEDDDQDDEWDDEWDEEELLRRQEQRLKIFDAFFEKTNEANRGKIVSYIFEMWGVNEGESFETDEGGIIAKDEAIAIKEKFIELIDADFCEGVYDEEDKYLEDLQKFNLKGWGDFMGD